MSIELSPNRDWLEDMAHENGNYLCRCGECAQHFIGHKRRVLCKVCVRAAHPAAEQAAAEGEREAFEAWHISYPMGLSEKDAYRAWQAARCPVRELTKEEVFAAFEKYRRADDALALPKYNATAFAREILAKATGEQSK